MQNATETGAESTKREGARSMLRETYGVEAAFMRVPSLAKVLGLAQPTIYAAMREGRFFIPHRMLNSSPAVSVEDFLDWYCQQEAPNARRRRKSRQASGRSNSAGSGAKAKLAPGRANAIAREVLRELGVDPDRG